MRWACLDEMLKRLRIDLEVRKGLERARSAASNSVWLRQGNRVLMGFFRNMLMSDDPLKVMEAGAYGATTQNNSSRSFR